MLTTSIRCPCGAVEFQLSGPPISQYYCHCDDCQTVQGKAYAVSLFSAAAVAVVRGDVNVFTLRTSPRTKCSRCGTYLFARVAAYAGVNGDLLPEAMFKPEFHIQCRFAAAPVKDDLPHYAGTPARFGGSDELMQW